MLPGEDGLSVLKRLRSNSDTKELPVILVTAKDSEIDTVRGLDLGAKAPTSSNAHTSYPFPFMA